MKKIIAICMIAITLISCFPMGGCFGGEPELINEIGELIAGHTVQIQYKQKEKEIPVDSFLYASEDPQIASVSDSGMIGAVKQGETVIHVQHKEKKSQKMTIPVKVTYALQPPADTVVEKEPKGEINVGMLHFWNEKEYVERIHDWDIPEIAKMVLNKSEGDYVFTDLRYRLRVMNDVLIPIADWGNGTVSLDRGLLEKDLCTYVAQAAEIEPHLLSDMGVARAAAQLKGSVGKVMDTMQGEIDLSVLPDSAEYRVYVSVNYAVYRTENYYSKGLLKGGLGTIWDLLTLKIDSFLESYTTSEVLYELELNSYRLVIECKEKNVELA